MKINEQCTSTSSGSPILHRTMSLTPPHQNSPVTNMDVAPMARAARRDSSPRGPAPHTSTVVPAVTRARLQACMATAKGSMRAPSSCVTLSGNLCQIFTVGFLHRCVNSYKAVFTSDRVSFRFVKDLMQNKQYRLEERLVSFVTSNQYSDKNVCGTPTCK